MEPQKGFDNLISGLKSLSLVVFIAIFLYWSVIALILYESQPTASSVSYRFGDDGQGNYKFPTITICLDSFKWVGRSPNGLNCSFKGPQGFLHHLIYCTFNKKVLVYPFEKIEDVIEASKILEITDILDSF